MTIKHLIFNTDGTSYIEEQEVLDEVFADESEDDDDIQTMTQSEIDEVINQSDTESAEAQ